MGIRFVSVWLLLGLGASHCFCAYSDGQPTVSTGRIRFVLDTASFRGSEGKVREELCLLIPNTQLKYESVGRESLEADIEAQIEFRRWPTGELLLRKKIDVVLQTPNSEVATGLHDLQMLQKEFSLDPGPYDVEMELVDRGTYGFGFFRLFGRDPNRGKAKGRFVAKRFTGQGLEMSDVQFARRIGTVHADVIPNPNRLYGALLPLLSFYYEVYDKVEDRDVGGQPYFVRHEIVDSDGVVHAQEEQVLSVGGGGSRFQHSSTLDLTSVPGGAYSLRVVVRSKERADSVVSESPFRVAWRQSDLASVGGAGATQAALFQEVLLVDEIAALRFLLIPDDLSLLESLQPEEQRSWVNEYWSSHDPTPGTEVNELRNEHYSRISHANRRFGSIRNKGMETDRGRIYVRYGEPDQILSGFSSKSFVTPPGGFSDLADQSKIGGARGGFNVDEKAYEIWVYSERGRFLGDRRNRGAGLQLEFVFVDVNGYGEYILVRSTDETEF